MHVRFLFTSQNTGFSKSLQAIFTSFHFSHALHSGCVCSDTMHIILLIYSFSSLVHLFYIEALNFLNMMCVYVFVHALFIFLNLKFVFVYFHMFAKCDILQEYNTFCKQMEAELNLPVYRRSFRVGN